MKPLDSARALLSAGIGVIPIPAGNNKVPVVVWTEYQTRLATEAEAVAWWGRESQGIAAVCGAVSGGLEVIDFDREADAIFPAWCALVEEMCPGLLERLIVVETPRDPCGIHVWFRCADACTPGARKLAGLSPSERAAEKAAVDVFNIDPANAAKPKRKTEYTLIETRGEGAYALVPGGDPRAHASGRPYRYRAERMPDDLATITPDERECLMVAARSFDRSDPPPETAFSPQVDGRLRPGEDYDLRGDWNDILPAAGWERVSQRGEEVRWRRPGKRDSWSATTGVCKGKDGADLLKVFSGNAEPFEEGKSYGKSAAVARLFHDGDFKAAVRDLARRGFGDQARNNGSQNGHGHPIPPPAAHPPPSSPKLSINDVATIGDLARAGAEIKWLWTGWIPSGSLTAMAAPGGTGKTRFCADLVRRIRHGLPWPDGQAMTVPPMSQVLWVIADNHHDEMVTLARDFKIEDSIRINAPANAPYDGVSLDTVDDLLALERRIEAVAPSMVIIDTVGNSTDRSLNKQEDAKAYYFPLQVLARKYGCAILCLTHLNAGGQFLGRRILEKVRTAIRMEQFPGETRRRLEVTKSNSKTPPALGVSMVDVGNDYDTDPPTAPEEGGFGPVAAKGPAPKTAEAMVWLADQLKSSPRRVKSLRDDAEDAGINVNSLYAAMRALKVEEGGTQGSKCWALPPKNDD